jgi:hypothetical protein
LLRGSRQHYGIFSSLLTFPFYKYLSCGASYVWLPLSFQGNERHVGNIAPARKAKTTTSRLIEGTRNDIVLRTGRWEKVRATTSLEVCIACGLWSNCSDNNTKSLVKHLTRKKCTIHYLCCCSCKKSFSNFNYIL